MQTPVTILTGFLGSGKTTLLNRILKENHGHRIAVIENEFGEAGIDNELLVQDSDEQIVEMNNGCICCTVRGDLVRILGELQAKKAAGTLHFDRVIIETTGLADPAPVAQTFFVDDEISQQYLLDAIVTMVDAKHAPAQLDEHHEAQEQVGFADRILITKTDVVQPDDVAQLRQRLVKMNPRAKIGEASHGQASIDDLLDIRGFNLTAILEIEPDFLTDVDHEHDDDVSSFVFRESRPLDLERVEDFLSAIVQVYGTQLMRYKGVLNIKGIDKRVVFQGVHMLMGSDAGAAWKPGEKRDSKMVFIGRDMPKDVLLDGLAQCVAGGAKPQSSPRSVEAMSEPTSVSARRSVALRCSPVALSVLMLTVLLQRGHALAQTPPAPEPTPAAVPRVTVVGEREVPALQQPAGSASRLGLTVRETPASIEVLSQGLLRERGARSVTEAALAATGVTAGDFPAEPANFSMRGFANSQINTLFNGLKIGPPNMTSRVMDVGNLERIEFLKGPASLMSGEGASGGAVNFVTRQPQRGKPQHEVNLSVGSFGALRTGFGSGGTTAVDSLDYRIDLNRSSGNGFIDDTGHKNRHLSGGLDWYAQPGLKLFGAVEFKNDDSSAYWGTPLVSAGAPGVQAKSGVVSGTYVSGFNGSDLGAVTLDRRTLRTNYNVLDNRNNAEESWLRLGADWQASTALTLRTQFYRFGAEREWFNNEIAAFNAATGLVDRERFYVAHDQTTVGNKSELQWDASVGGMRNRLVAALEWADTQFVRPGAANFPGDSVSLVDPQRGTYGLLTTQRQTADITNLALAVEDRLLLSPGLALIAGLRHESIALDRSSANAAGVQRAGFPFSKTWRPTTGRLGLTWDLAPELTLYGQYATAADVAANNLFLLRANQPLELTRTRTVEVGVKQSFWAQRGEWTLALYDIQRSNVYAAQGGQALALAGKQASRGAELSASLRTATAWRVWGNLALNRVRYADYTTAGGSLSGNSPPNAPKLVANAGATYRWGGDWPVELSGSVRRVGERFHSDANTVKLAAYTVADAAVAVDLQPRTRLSLRVRNLADRTYAIWSDPFYPDQILLGAPRSVELSLNLRF